MNEKLSEWYLGEMKRRGTEIFLPLSIGVYKNTFGFNSYLCIYFSETFHLNLWWCNDDHSSEQEAWTCAQDKALKWAGELVKGRNETQEPS